MARKIAIATGWEKEDMAGLFQTESPLVFARRILLDRSSDARLRRMEERPRDAEDSSEDKPTR